MGCFRMIFICCYGYLLIYAMVKIIIVFYDAIFYIINVVNDELNWRIIKLFNKYSFYIINYFGQLLYFYSISALNL